MRDVIYVYPFSFFRELANARKVLVKDSLHNTALHLAASHNRLELVKYLVEDHGADVNVKTKSLATPLHFAAASNCNPVVEYLILKGAKIDGKDEKGDTPLQIACR